MRTNKLIRIIAFALVLSLLTGLAATALAGYSTIPYGERSDKVRKMQKALKEKNCYSGSVDGKFGPATKEAVKKFQRSIGLRADGKPGNKTLTALYDGVDKVNTSAKEERKTTTKNPRTLYYGSSGSRVEDLQKALKAVGCYKGSIDGHYGDLTYEAVKRFQSRNGLHSDGKAGPKTLDKLNASSSSKVSTGFVLQKGSTGSEVSNLQGFLKSEGYACAGEGLDFWGTFGDKTESQLQAWQASHSKPVDGKMSESDYNNFVVK